MAEEHAKVATAKDGEYASTYAFLITGDPQYLAEKSQVPSRLDPYSEQASSRFLEIVKHFPGTKIPETLGGGEVSQRILGVLVNGDLIDSADKTGGPHPAMQRFEWARFTTDYGLTGMDGGLPYPIYELHGNHDGPQGDTFIIDDIITRNKNRIGVVNRSENGLHYSWNWGPLHLVNLGIFVGEGNARRQDFHYSPRSSLEFLREDLIKHVGDSGRPIVLSFHLHPNCPSFDWPPEDLFNFWETISDYNVVALFHGHTHGDARRMQWNGKEFAAELRDGVDIFDPDDSSASKTDPKKPNQGIGLRHGFLYVELIDRPGIEDDQFIVRSYVSKDNWASHDWQDAWSKPIRVPDQLPNREIKDP